MRTASPWTRRRASAWAPAIPAATVPPSATEPSSLARRHPRHALSDLRAQVCGAGHQAVHVLLSRAIAGHPHAPLLPLGDPGRPLSHRARHRILRRGRPAARGPEVGEPGGHAGAGGGEGGGGAGGADLAPALGSLGWLPVLSRRALLGAARGDGVLDRLRGAARALPPLRGGGA